MKTQAKNWEVVHKASGVVAIQFVSRLQAERYARAMPGCYARMIQQLRRTG